MDTTREHLWGKLLLERRMLEQERLQQLVAERDERIRRGQGCSLGQLLVQKRFLDPRHYHSISNEIEGRGRACFACRRVFFSARPEDPPTCPQCGGSTRLPPRAGTGRHPVPAGPPAAPAGTGIFRATGYGTPAGTGHFPAASPAGTGHFPAATPPSGRFAPATGNFPANGGSGRFTPTTGSGTGQYTPVSGAYPPMHSTPATGMFRRPSGGYPGVMGSGDALVRPPASTAAELQSVEDLDSGEIGVGKRLARYELLAELGRGGMGVVYKARSLDPPHAVVALKVLIAGEFASERLQARFREEAILSQKLRHPNIVGVHDVGEVDGLLYYTMDFIEGQELQDLVRGKSLSVRRGAEILVAVAQAAHHAHENGVVHRDLKPSNILIGSDGKPYIMDFGLAKNLEDDKGLTRSGVAIGTPYYMPPEQARGNTREMDARADVYALGAILYEMACRRVPFTAKTQNELLRKIIEQEPTPPRQIRAGVPQDIETICLKCLRKEKELRYESALDLAEDLERYLDGEPILARPPGFWVPWVRKVRQNQNTAIVVAAAALAVLMALLIVAKLHADHQEQLRQDQLRREAEEAAEQERLRLEEEARAREEARLAAIAEERRTAEEAISRGRDAFGAARSAVSTREARQNLEQAEAAFSQAIAIQRKLDGQEDGATVYRRALARRALCRWDDAQRDLLFASKSPTHQARANLARGLVKLRRHVDAEGARTILSQAVSAGEAEGIEAREEEVATRIAQAYLAYVQGNDHAFARQQLSDLSGEGRLGTLAAEVHGGLAYLERCKGEMLGGDVFAERGLRAADQAVASEKLRFEFLVDRAILRARQGREGLPQALDDQREARDLDPDNEWADLAAALIHTVGNDRKRADEAIEAALAKARDGSSSGAAAVRSFVTRLEEARREASRPETIRGTRSATLTFSAGNNRAGRMSSLQIETSEEVVAVLVSLREARGDLDLYVSEGTKATRPELADFASAGSSVDETILIRRDGTPPLKTGSYMVIVRQPASFGIEVKAKLSITYLRAGDELPWVWHGYEQLRINATDGKAINEAIKEYRTGDRAQGMAEIARLSDRPGNAQLKMLHGDMLLAEQRYADARAVLLPVVELYPDHPRVYAHLGVAELHLAKRDSALDRFRLAMEKDPRCLSVRKALARGFLELNEPSKALKVVAEAAALASHPDLGYLAGRAHLERDQAEQGVEQLKAAALEGQASAETQLLILDALIGGKQAGAALETVEALMRRYPRLDLDMMRGVALSALNRQDEARRHLEVIRTKVRSPANIKLVEDLLARIARGENLSSLRQLD